MIQKAGQRPGIVLLPGSRAFISTMPDCEKQNLFHVWIIAVW